LLILDNVLVVLVEPQHGGNIGSAARAMRNMGLCRLRLVRPRQLLNRECCMMAGKAVDLVHSAEVYSSLEDALEDVHVVVGTTSTRDRQESQLIHTPREVASRIAACSPLENVALLFGSERSGLRDDHLARCRYVAAIPSSPRHPVLNLSQAVVILAYEVFTANREEGRDWCVASHREHEEMFAQIREVLVETGFLSASHPEHIMRSVRRILTRCDLKP